MLPEGRTRLLHMIEAAEAACGFITGRVRPKLDSDRMLVFALLRPIEIFGEAAAGLSASTREAAADIPWGLIVSMRNRLIHAYFDIDHEIVWNAATEELPQLVPRLRELIGNAGGDG